MINDVNPFFLTLFERSVCNKKSFLLAAEEFKNKPSEKVYLNFGMKPKEDAGEMHIYFALLSDHDCHVSHDIYERAVVVSDKPPYYSLHENYDEIVAFIAKQLPE